MSILLGLRRLVSVPAVRPISPTALVVELPQTDFEVCDLDCYRFTNGLEVLGVIRLDGSTVEIQTTPQEPDQIYELEIVP